MTVLTPVTREQLAALAAEIPAEPPAEPRRAAGQAWRYGLPARPFDLAQWIDEHGLDVREKQDWRGGKRWIFRVCPWNSEHRDRSAYIVQFASGAIAAGCHHNGCHGRDWHALRDLVEPGWRERASANGRSWEPAAQRAVAPDQAGDGPNDAAEQPGEPARAGESDQPGWPPGAMDGELRWGGRSGNRAYLRHGQLRYTVTPEGEGLRVKVAAGNRGSVEVILDVDPGSPDLDAIAGRVAGALETPVADVRADLAALPAQWAAHPAAAELPPPADPQTLADFAPWVTARLNERATRAAKDVVGETICRWLLERGALICDGDRGAPYLLADDGGMLALTDNESLALQAAVSRCGVNPAEPAFDWLYHDLRTTAANEGRRVQVRRFSFSDPATSTVYASCGPRGYVVARPGQKLEWRRNGADDIIFAADAVLPEWDWQAEPLSPLELQAFQPALAAPLEVPDYTPEIQQALLGVFLAGMIANLRPLPLLALLGNKGGGKSTLGRAIIRIIYGPASGVTPLSDDPRDFWAMAKMRLCFALDNVDAEPPPWLVDALAVVATGGRKQSRKLYTDEELTDKEMRAAVVITSRTAPFARPDVAERILPLTTVEFSDARRRADSEIDREVVEYRSEVFAYLVTAAAQHAVVGATGAGRAAGALPGLRSPGLGLVRGHGAAGAGHPSSERLARSPGARRGRRRSAVARDPGVRAGRGDPTAHRHRFRARAGGRRRDAAPPGWGQGHRAPAAGAARQPEPGGLGADRGAGQGEQALVLHPAPLPRRWPAWRRIVSEPVAREFRNRGIFSRLARYKGGDSLTPRRGNVEKFPRFLDSRANSERTRRKCRPEGTEQGQETPDGGEKDRHGRQRARR